MLMPIHTETSDTRTATNVSGCPVRPSDRKRQRRVIIRHCLFAGTASGLSVGAKRVRFDAIRARQPSRSAPLSGFPALLGERIPGSVRPDRTGAPPPRVCRRLETPQTIVAAAAGLMNEDQAGGFISTACPAVVNYIENSFPPRPFLTASPARDRPCPPLRSLWAISESSLPARASQRGRRPPRNAILRSPSRTGGLVYPRAH